MESGESPKQSWTWMGGLSAVLPLNVQCLPAHYRSKESGGEFSVKDRMYLPLSLELCAFHSFKKHFALLFLTSECAKFPP